MLIYDEQWHNNAHAEVKTFNAWNGGMRPYQTVRELDTAFIPLQETEWKSTASRTKRAPAPDPRGVRAKRACYTTKRPVFLTSCDLPSNPVFQNYSKRLYNTLKTNIKKINTWKYFWFEFVLINNLLTSQEQKKISLFRAISRITS